MAKRKITLRPGTVYFLYNEANEPIYVGMTIHGLRRLRTHSQVQPWWSEVHHAEFKHYSTEYLTRKSEAYYIAALRPRYNIQYPAKGLCSNCRWSMVKSKGLCAACIAYERRTGVTRPEAIIVAHARRLQESQDLGVPYRRRRVA